MEEKLLIIKDKYFGKETISEAVFHTLYEAIEEGVFPVGSRLLENEIAGALDVSRTPVREAIKYLINEGIVEYTMHGSICVKEFSFKEVCDMFQAFELIRIITTREAAYVIDRAHLSKIKAVLDEITSLPEKNPDEKEQAAQRYLLDEQFHYLICLATGNTYLIEFYEKITKLIKFIHKSEIYGELASASNPIANAQRDQIYEALENRDSEAAYQLATAHSKHVFIRLAALRQH